MSLLALGPVYSLSPGVDLHSTYTTQSISNPFYNITQEQTKNKPHYIFIKHCHCQGSNFGVKTGLLFKGTRCLKIGGLGYESVCYEINMVGKMLHKMIPTIFIL